MEIESTSLSQFPLASTSIVASAEGIVPAAPSMNVTPIQAVGKYYLQKAIDDNFQFKSGHPSGKSAPKTLADLVKR